MAAMSCVYKKGVIPACGQMVQAATFLSIVLDFSVVRGRGKSNIPTCSTNLVEGFLFSPSEQLSLEFVTPPTKLTETSEHHQISASHFLKDSSFVAARSNETRSRESGTVYG